MLVKELLDHAARTASIRSRRLTLPSKPAARCSVAYYSLGMLDESRQTSSARRRALPRRRKRLGTPAHARAELAGHHLERSRHEQGGRVGVAESLRLTREKIGADHPDAIATQSTLGLALMQQDKLADADRMLSDALERMKRLPGVDIEGRASVVDNLAAIRAEGRVTEATMLYRDLLKELKASQGEDHPNTIAVSNNVAEMLRQQGDYAAAVDSSCPCWKSGRVNGPDHLSTLTILNNLCAELRVDGPIRRGPANVCGSDRASASQVRRRSLRPALARGTTDCCFSR